MTVVLIRDAKGEWRDEVLLATGRDVPAAFVLSGYCRRWGIETFHKLLKGAGWEWEKWRQRNGERLRRKLLVGLAAVVEVWALERRTDVASEEFRRRLMALSGRQTKWSVPVTTTGLLAGLWVLQQAASWLAGDGPNAPNALREKHLPLFAHARRQV